MDERNLQGDPCICGLFQQVYLNTSSMIAYMIQTNFSSRHDLALLYYPSAFEFYWFVARTFGELQRRSKEGPLPHPVCKICNNKIVSLSISGINSLALGRIEICYFRKKQTIALETRNYENYWGLFESKMSRNPDDRLVGMVIGPRNCENNP